MADSVAHAVLYGAKSTEDTHGSIGGQLADAHALATGEGMTIGGHHTDESFSAYSGNRGPGLAAAMDNAAALAEQHGGCALVVQHSDRLSRGDGRQANHLVEYAIWAIKTGVVLMSVEDPQTFGNLAFTAMMGERNNEDSKRKAASVSKGMRRRNARGLHSAGPDKFGYQTRRDQFGTPYKAQPLAVVPAEARVVERIFGGIARGTSQKQMARDLNDAGIPTKRGGRWSQSLISHIVTDPFYAGYVKAGDEYFEGRHDAIVGMGLVEQAKAMSARRYKRGDGQGGRPPKRPALFTNGHLRCGECGSAMGLRNKATKTDKSVYMYSKYHCTGREREVRSCSMRPIDADAIEAGMLHRFNKTRGQLAGRVKDAVAAMLHDRDLTADQLKAATTELAKVDASFQRIDGDYLAGTLPADRYAALKDRLEQDRAGAQANVDRLAARDRELAATLGRDDLDGIVARVMDGIASAVAASASIEERRNAMRSVWPSVIAHRDGDDVTLDTPAVGDTFARDLAAAAH
jgi:DNA invertase Pin-like site-specific DNA recombinase